MTTDGNGIANANVNSALEGEPVTLTAVPKNGYRFLEWQVISGGAALGDEADNPATFTMPDNAVEVRAVFEALPFGNHLITVTTDGNGTATADVDFAPWYQLVTLSAVPDNGYYFAEWQVISGGILLDNATADVTSFTMPANTVVVKAVFAALPTDNYLITVTTDGNGIAVANDGVKFAPQGELVTLSAIPNDGYRFAEWQVISGGATLGDETNNPATFTMPANAVVVKALFEEVPSPPDKYTVTVISGTADDDEYEEGATVTVTAGTPPEGQRFKNWTSEPSVDFADGSDAETTFEMPASDVTVTANFEMITSPPPDKYTVTVISGTADDDEYEEGATVTVTAGTPPEGQRFKNWTSEPSVDFADGSDAETTFEMPASDVIVTANFEMITSPPPDPVTYTVTVVNGTVSSDKFEVGAIVNISAGTPPAGQQFKNWTTASTGVTFANAAQANTIFEMPASNVTVTANFEAIPSGNYLITVTVEGNGIANAEVNSAPQGATVMLTAIANSGNRFAGWQIVSGGVTLADAAAPFVTFAMPTNAVAVKAVFEAIPEPPSVTYAVTVVNGVASSDKFEGGAMVYLHALIPPTGKRFKNWTTENIGVIFHSPASVITTFTMPAGNVTVTANFEDIPPPPPTYTVTFKDHDGTVVGEPQTIEHGSGAIAPADPIREGYTFTGWLPSAFDNITANLDVVAQYKIDEVIDPPSAYSVTLAGVGKRGSGGGNYAPGAVVSLSAGITPEGMRFVSWTTASPGVTFKNAKAGKTTFVMPPNAVDITAEFEAYTAPMRFNVTAGPNPVALSDGKVNFYVTDPSFSLATFVIYNATGNVVRKIKFSGGASVSGEPIGSWDLKDAKSKSVAAGSYLIRGSVIMPSGKTEAVSFILSVR